MFLEGVDLVITRLDALPWGKPLHPRGDNVLIVRAIENADHADGRHREMNAPEKVVRQFLCGGLLETGSDDAEGIDRTEYYPNRAVLATRVHALQHDEDGVLGLGVEDFLQARDLRGVRRRRLLRLGLAVRQPVLVPRIDLDEFRQSAGRRDPIALEGAKIDRGKHKSFESPVGPKPDDKRPG